MANKTEARQERAKDGVKTEVIRQSYDYSFLFDLLEMARGNLPVISCDKKLHRLYMAVLNYVNSRLPEIDGDIIDFDISITVNR